MSKYIVETFYTCTFKIIHKLDELSEKKLADLENRNDGEVRIIDVQLNNRKTRTDSKKESFQEPTTDTKKKNLPDFSAIVSDKISKQILL